MRIHLEEISCEVAPSGGFRGRIPLLRKFLPKKTLVEDFTVSLQSDTLIAVMGPSGSGKTSLLLSLAGRYESARVKGWVGYGEERVPMKKMKEWGEGVVAFVPQREYLWSHLTVRETLRIAALMYLPATFTIMERVQRAEDTLSLMELTEVGDILIGDANTKGISSGEKRRVAIAMELISLPKILLVDEPTTGLDATAAMKVMEVLKKVALSGCTVIATVHQPRKEIFSMLDQVIYIKEGKLCFSGTTMEAKRYFMKLGFDVTQKKSMASSIDAILSHNVLPQFSQTLELEDSPAVKGSVTKQEESKERMKLSDLKESAFFKSFNEEERSRKQNHNIAFSAAYSCLGYLQSFIWLSYRELLYWWRNRFVFIAFLVLNTVMAPVLGSLFSNFSSSNEAVNRAQALLVALIWLSTTPNICGLRVAGEHWLLRWEVGQGLYSELPFIWVRFCFDALVFTLYATMFTTGWYWVCDFEHDVGNYWYYVLMGILQMVMVATSSKMVMYFIPSLIVGNSLLSLLSFFTAGCAGYAVTYSNLPEFWQGLFWANPTSYYTMATVQRELMETASGRLLLAELNFPVSELFYVYPLAMIGFMALMVVISHFAFRFLNKGTF